MTFADYIADYIADLVAHRASHQPGDIIQPMAYVVAEPGAERTRRTMRVLVRHEWPDRHASYTAIDKHGRAHPISVADDPRAGCLSDAEEEP